jgi:hypothetical protein
VAPRSPARKVTPHSCAHWLTSAAKPTADTMPIASRRASPSAESAAGPRKRARARREVVGGGGGGGSAARLAARASREEEEEEEDEDDEDELLLLLLLDDDDDDDDILADCAAACEEARRGASPAWRGACLLSLSLSRRAERPPARSPRLAAEGGEQRDPKGSRGRASRAARVFWRRDPTKARARASERANGEEGRARGAQCAPSARRRRALRRRLRVRGAGDDDVHPRAQHANHAALTPMRSRKVLEEARPTARRPSLRRAVRAQHVLARGVTVEDGHCERCAAGHGLEGKGSGGARRGAEQRDDGRVVTTDC